MLQELLTNGLTEDRKFTIPAPQLTNGVISTSEAPPQEKLQCPRCNSTNTKFCYYNNYNLTQPRHFCKTCRRYWTKGGALRNVPIGGGCRKSKSSSAPHKVRPMMTSTDDIIGFESTIPKRVPLGLGTYNSHLLDLLKGSNHFMQKPYNLNLNSSLNSFRLIKEEMGDGVYIYQQQMQKSKLLGDVATSSGIDELYQTLQRSNNNNGQLEKMTGINSRTSSANYDNYCPSVVLTGTVSAGTDSSMAQIPLHNGDIGTWSDVSASYAYFH